jgi:hypothetical protein
MSFHRRSFSWESIHTKKSRGTNFNHFDMWVMKPDDRSFSDDFSFFYIENYSELEKEFREIVFDNTKDDQKLLVDLFKLIRVIKNKENKEIHFPHIETYKKLWEKKWGFIPKELK